MGCTIFASYAHLLLGALPHDDSFVWWTCTFTSDIEANSCQFSPFPLINYGKDNMVLEIAVVTVFPQILRMPVRSFK